jgi:hypothetical protein
MRETVWEGNQKVRSVGVEFVGNQEINISNDANLRHGDAKGLGDSLAFRQDWCHPFRVKYLIFKQFFESVCKKSKYCQDIRRSFRQRKIRKQFNFGIVGSEMRKAHFRAVCFNLRDADLPEVISVSACSGHDVRPIQYCPGALEVEGTDSPIASERYCPPLWINRFLRESQGICGEFISGQLETLIQ